MFAIKERVRPLVSIAIFISFVAGFSLLIRYIGPIRMVHASVEKRLAPISVNYLSMYSISLVGLPDGHDYFIIHCSTEGTGAGIVHAAGCRKCVGTTAEQVPPSPANP